MTSTQTLSSVTASGTVSTIVTGLKSSTLYHYRAVATSGSGSSVGADATFVTPAPTAPPVIGSALTATGYLTLPFTYTIAASNGPTYYSAIGLPPGLSVNTSTGVISGTPTTACTSSVTLNASNAMGTGSATLVLTILPTTVPTTAFYYYSSTNSYVGGGNSQLYTTASGTAFKASKNYDNGVSIDVNGLGDGWSISFAAPGDAPLTKGTTYLGATRFPFQSGNPGLSFTGNGRGNNTLTGWFTVLDIVYGSDSNIVSFAADFVQYDEGNTNAWNVGSVRYNSIIPGNFPSAPEINTVYTTAINTVGATLNATVKPNGLPTTVSFEYGTEKTYGTTTATQTFSGKLVNAPVTSVVAGLKSGTLYHYRVIAKSSAGTVYSPDTTFTTTPSTLPPVIIGQSTVTGYLAMPFTYTISATNGPTSFNATGLPPGLSVNTSTGVISGTPTAIGTSSVTISARNPIGTSSLTQLIAIVPTVAPGNAFYYYSSSSAWVGQGKSQLYTGSSITASKNYDNGVDLRINNGSDWWTVSFAAAGDAPLAPGTYLGATRYPFQSASDPGLCWSGNGRGNNTLNGWFRILEITYGTGSTIVSVAADFVQYDEKNESAWNVGSIRYNSILPVTYPQAPAISAVSAASGGLTSATLSTTVNPNGLATTVNFEYGTDITYGSVTSNQSLGGLASTPLIGTLSGLKSGTVYHYRVVARSAAGTSTSADATFITDASSSAPGIISPTKAVGTINVPFLYQIAAVNNPTSYSATGLPPGLSLNTVSGLISGIPVQIGTFNAGISASNSWGAGSIIVAFTIQNPLDAWKGRNFSASELDDPTISGDTAAPAGDGIPNLLKYALHIDPKTSTPSDLPVPSVMSSGGENYLTITYTQLILAGDIEYITEISTDLKTWNSGAGYTAPVSVTNNPDGVTQTVVVQDLKPLSSSEKRFIRLKINKP